MVTSNYVFINNSRVSKDLNKIAEKQEKRREKMVNNS